MAEMSDSTTGVAAVPYDGKKTPCGFMRATKHVCGDPTCPIDRGYLMAFDRNPGKAMVVSRGLWGIWNQPTLLERFTVRGPTLMLANKSFEQELLEGSSSALFAFRALIEEHDEPVIHMTLAGVLFSFAGSPDEMWIPRKTPFTLPAFAEPTRPVFEHQSWFAGKLERAEDLIADINDEEEDEKGL